MVGDAVAADQTTPTVLIVDDEPDMRMALKMMLRRGGRFAVVGEADDGRAAIDAADTHQPDIVLLDLMMPGVDGWQALEELPAVAPRSMIVVLSALDATEHQARVTSRGAFAFLDKQEATARLGDRLEELYAGYLGTGSDQDTVSRRSSNPRRS